MNNINIHLLNASGSLNPFNKDIESITKISIKKVVNVIPVSDVDIVLYDDPPNTIPHLGIGGYTSSFQLIFITLNSKHKKFKYLINQYLERVIVHEIYHTLRWKHHEFNKNLLDAMIFEGLADHFDIEITKKKLQRWDTALTNKQLIDFHEKAKMEYFNNKYDYYAWFFGSKEKKIPKWTGYTRGFDLVRKYLKNHPSKPRTPTLRSGHSGCGVNIELAPK